MASTRPAVKALGRAVNLGSQMHQKISALGITPVRIWTGFQYTIGISRQDAFKHIAFVAEGMKDQPPTSLLIADLFHISNFANSLLEARCEQGYFYWPEMDWPVDIEPQATHNLI